MPANTLIWLTAGSQMLSTLAVLLSAILAFFTIIYNVGMARKSQTATFLFESRFDKRYLDGLQALRRIHYSGRSFRSYIFSTHNMTEEENDDIQNIIYCLNFYERLAVSIRHGIYHEIMIKDVFYSSVVNNFAIAEPLIKAIREKEQRNSYYQEYEFLAIAWSGTPLAVKSGG
ncbi:DUF4760 domain-containing protein [Entomohabitans teleogrylli]|uniref:DUF4760 domain-containing protein n=1 Tax=Entomohabitans teleogrylli TaxID=1384589 RepID=UPI00073D732E|nr:DUF4760 domain-containing protein [Entomohabitans teleogrylli]